SETCRKCNSNDCTNNILEEIIANQKLTSGYFGFSKPKGKCSHGGIFDLSSWFQGGINKDTMHSNHGYLHEVAASVAAAATRELLEDIRAAIGDAEFLRLMGLSQTSVLCFVIDTTASMSDDIAEVKRVASSIIDSKKGTAAQPSEYILVPFNDPGQSEVDFLFDFVELSQGLHPSYVVLNSRPAAKTNVTLLVSMIGGNNMRPTEVSLVEASRLSSLNGTLVDIGSRQYLVTFNSIPGGEFTVHMVGETSFSRTSNDHFQRQSATQFRASSLTITTEPVGTINPGKPFALLFRVATSGSGGTFDIRVTNDRKFETHFKTSVALKNGGSANVTVIIVAPGETPSGTDVTVTIYAVAPSERDFNYAVLRLPVVAP
ncbi:von Willebrand factor A domain-containing protein 7-like, partial [Clarias magur]